MSRDQVKVSLVATREAMVSPVSGLFETLGAIGGLDSPEARAAEEEPFAVEIVGERAGPLAGASGLSIEVGRSVDEVGATDIVVVPSMAMSEVESWRAGRHPRLVEWLRRMHAGGAVICSACTGGMLTAETGLLDGREATAHWIIVNTMRRSYPEVKLRPERALVVSGENDSLVTSGASTAWHDLVLYLVARFVGPATAQALCRFQLLQWHADGQEPFEVFSPPLDHGDAAVLAAQRWLAESFAAAAPVEEMARVAGLAPTTFKRRFKAATGLTPIAYAQRVRVENAKRRLESGGDSVEEIAWAVGYDDPASFRRLFKRLTGLTPGEYRRRFRLPDLPGVPA